MLIKCKYTQVKGNNKLTYIVKNAKPQESAKANEYTVLLIFIGVNSVIIRNGRDTRPK